MIKRKIVELEVQDVLKQFLELARQSNGDPTDKTGVLHPTKEGQFPRDPILFGQTPVFLEGPWSGDSETVGEIEKGVRIFLREPFSQ